MKVFLLLNSLVLAVSLVGCTHAPIIAQTTVDPASITPCKVVEPVVCPPMDCPQPEPVVCPSVPVAAASQERAIDKVYYGSGEVFSETNLFSDRNNGFYKTFHRNGQLATELRYQNGLQIYDKAFDSQGQPMMRQGVVSTYYADGTLASRGVYRLDQKHGQEVFFDYDGKTPVDIWRFYNGRKVDFHLRRDPSGQWKVMEDWGYPTSYVLRLKFIIGALCGLLIGLLVWGGWVLAKNRKRM